MNKLDDLNLLKTLDPSRTLPSISFLADQCETAWNQSKQIVLPKEYSDIKSVVFSGMGGSAYGARIIKSLFGSHMKVPIDIVNDYHLPAYVDDNTLVILASYSGTTEETISCAHDALSKKAKIVGISSGGPLCDLITYENKPFYRFEPTFNPSNQPRIGQGYMQFGQMGLLFSLGLLPIDESDVSQTIELLRSNANLYSMGVSFESNKAKQLAQKYSELVVNFIAAEFLEGSTHAIRNPFHETGKHFANYFIVPELNHHLMEGLSFPNVIKNDFLFVLISSTLYSPVIQKRMNLTKEVIEKNGVKTDMLELFGKSPLSQVFELIQLGSFVTFYLAMLHNIDPAQIPWVSYFKENLKN